MTNQEKVTKAAAVLGSTVLISRIFGFVRDMIVARVFGAGMVADAFFIAYRIPALLRELFAEGSMSAAFIPVFSGYLHEQGREEALKVAKSTFTILIIILFIITIVGIAAAPWVVALIAPGFHATSSKFDLTVHLTQIMFPYLLFVSIAALFMGILNTLGSFVIPGLSSVALSIFMISGVYLFAPFFSIPIYGLAIGVFLGGICQFAIQIPSLWKRNMKMGWYLKPVHPGVFQIGKLMIPMILGLSVTQVNIFVDSVLSSYLDEGSVAYLYYGIRLIHFPLGIFGVAMASAILPTLSASAIKKDYAEVRNTYSFAARLLLFITLPAMVGLIVLRIPIVSVLFQSRAFNFTATLGTADALLYYSVGLWAFAGTRVTAQVFYSLKDTKTPVKAGLIAMIVNVVFSIILMKPLKHGGLALGTSIAAMVNLSFLVWALRKKLGRINMMEIAGSLKTIVPANILMGLVAWLISRGNIWAVNGRLSLKAGILLASIVMSTLTYIAVLHISKNKELQFLWGMFRAKKQRI
ncbi:MAG: murein biosynthesis integral membrane protein MurJ [Nitrospira sp.]|nr:murein biosynthesis integral membrane protein MurJ [Nitrospira sp.]